MKFWYGHGSEHSMNLVMIGHFQSSRDAETAGQVIEWLTNLVNTDEEAGLIKIGGETSHFTDGMRALLDKVKVYSIGASELEQFAYDVSVKVENDRVVITTDEIDVSAFMKVLIDKGARVEVYSAHDYSDSEYGRGR